MPERLTLNNATIRAFCLDQGWEVPAPGSTYLFGIRGARPVGVNEVEVHDALPGSNRYDDTLGVGGAAWLLVPGTTDPGKHYIQAPMNARGAAFLVPGVYRYRKGLHKGKHAFVQAGSVWVRRDRDRDGRPEMSDGPRERLAASLNIHRMGSGRLPVEVWSAGCQGVPRETWEAFYEVASKAADPVLYVLMDGHLLERYLKPKHV
jgi:hypothetical protein